MLTHENTNTKNFEQASMAQVMKKITHSTDQDTKNDTNEF
jgi:hypothetical protein